MAIKYYSNPSKKQIIAVLSNTSMDAINKIAKVTADHPFFCMNEKYTMPDKFRAVATCMDGDEFDEAVGKEIAKKKLMKRYYKSFDKRVEMFKEDLIMLNSRVFPVTVHEENI